MGELIYKIIVNPIFNIICLFIGYLAGHRLAIGREKRKEFNSAAASFRDAFVDEIRLLKKDKVLRPSWGGFSEGSQTAYEIVGGSINKHETAYITFRHYVGRLQRKGFDSTWHQYAEPNKQIVPSQPFIEYDSLGDFQKEKDIRKDILHRIENLLNYAKPK